MAQEHESVAPNGSYDETLASIAVFVRDHYQELIKKGTKADGPNPSLVEELLQRAVCRAFRQLEGLRSEPLAMAESALSMHQVAYWLTAIRNQFLDELKRQKGKGGKPRTDSYREDWESDSRGPAEGVTSSLSRGPKISPYEDPPEVVIIAREERSLLTVALRTVLEVLADRGMWNPMPSVRITSAEWRTLQTWHELDDENEGVNLRGSWAATAVDQRIGRSAVSNHVKRVSAALTMTRYLAGVLAENGTLLDAEAIHRCLDSYEDMIRDRAEAASWLKAGAMCVNTTIDRGTRVDPNLLSESLELFSEQESLDTLHFWENEHAERIHSAFPNCVTMCPRHTSTYSDRTTEF